MNGTREVWSRSIHGSCSLTVDPSLHVPFSLSQVFAYLVGGQLVQLGGYLRRQQEAIVLRFGSASPARLTEATIPVYLCAAIVCQ
jgi:hypothetical protein